ncbi:MAG: proline--tRNA ligase [Fimbriimonadaceae bacterium]|nr:proline--tRNA ligase [Fimbriimonadaceae bacterium]QYK58601.1 MAG: proline--tRNA ligase [Fimbriimonadaceae bacterium]
MAKDLGITSRSENYSEWYNELVKRADLAENSVVRGCMVVKPNGYAIWELMRDALDGMFKATGHVNAAFPMLIPKSFFEKEAEHVEGFAKECAIVTHHRLTTGPDGKGLVPDPDAELEEPLVIRPTSETIIWHSFKNWIQSWRDLPILINQWANVMRWELRPRLFLRTAEFFWQEGHTAHATYDEAEEEALKILEIYRRFSEEWMAVPVLTGVKSDGEKFAGADHTYTIEAMTQDGRAIQAGTSHHLGQNFAKAFDVRYQSPEGKEELVWATSWGVSTRLIGTMIMVHSDDRGLVCPPRLAPHQVVIVPIAKGDDRDRVNAAADRMAETLRETLWNGAPIRVKVDYRDNLSPGFKFNDWELKGACVRIELGPRDLDAEQAVVARRDMGDKSPVGFSLLSDAVTSALSGMHDNLFERALRFREQNTRRVDSWEEFKEAFEGDGGGGFVLAHWDGTQETEDRIKAETKATIRCILRTPLDPADEQPGQCVVSGRPSARRVVFAKAY